MRVHKRVERTCPPPMRPGLYGPGHGRLQHQEGREGWGLLRQGLRGPGGVAAQETGAHHVTPAQVLWALYGAGFLFALGWAMASAKHDPHLQDYDLSVKLVGCALVALVWPALLLQQDSSEDGDDGRDGPVS